MELSAAQVMELVLVQLGHLVRPCVDRLAAFQPQSSRQLGSAPEMLDRVGLLHVEDGKSVSRTMSIAFTADFAGGGENPWMSPKTPIQLDVERATLAERLEAILALRQTNPNKVEQITGITRQTLYAVLKNKTKTFSYPHLKALSKLLGVRPEWLADGRMPMYPAPELKDDDEIQLVHDFRDMSPAHQHDLAEIARRWAEEDSERPSASRPFLPRRPPKQ